MDLFVSSNLQFEKTAATSAMSEDPNQWPQEALQELFKQVPYISDFMPQVSMQKADAERGYGIGFIVVSNKSEMQNGATAGDQRSAGIKQVRIPIVIKDGQLSPFDVMVTETSKILPLTESRLRSALFRPQAFDVTGKTPGDQSMIGQLYPPYRMNYGQAGVIMPGAGDMGKTSSALEQYLEKSAIAGGKAQAEGKKASDFDPKQVAMGKEVESEHTSDPKVQERILADHLAEFPDYYTRLKKMEDEAKKTKEGAFYPSRAAVRTLARRSATKGMETAGEVSRKGGTSATQSFYERAKEGSVLQAILPTINASDLDAFRATITDPDVRLAYEKNAAATVGSVSQLLKHEPVKLASPLTVAEPSVVQVMRVNDGYLVKMASHRAWAPQVFQLDRGQALQKLGSKIVLAADETGAVTMADEGVGAPEQEPEESAPGPVEAPGTYKVQRDDGEELVGVVLPSLVDVDGGEVPIALFTNGSQAAVQTDVLGALVSQDAALPASEEPPGGYGVFFTDEGGELKATIPLKLMAEVAGPAQGEPSAFSAETYDGRPIQVSVQPDIQIVTGSPDGTMLIPAHWQWSSMEGADNVALAGAEQEVNKQAEARRHFASVEIRGNGESFSITGPAVEKLASDEKYFLGLNDAMFLLAGLGVNQQYGIQKLGEASSGWHPVQVRIGRLIRTAEEQQKIAQARAQETLSRLPVLRRQLFKEAAVISDPDAVDTVLSLGFINPENLVAFVGYIPKIDETQTKLCELLLASRLGLSDVPEGALERSIRATEEVIEGLKTLAFQEPSEYN